MFGQAMQLGVLDNAGLAPDSFALQARRLQDVTADQVREVARRFLVDDGLTVAVLEPERGPGAGPAAAKEPTP
jgi:zinc protease